MKIVFCNSFLLLIMLAVSNLIVFGSGCSQKTQNPEHIVKSFLEAASYGDTDTMKLLSVGRMKEEILRDEQALKKLVFLEQQGISDEANQEALKNSESSEGKIAKKKSGEFDFSFQILREQTIIEQEHQAKVSVYLIRKGIYVKRTYELFWVNSGWLIAQYYNEEE